MIETNETYDVNRSLDTTPRDPFEIFEIPKDLPSTEQQAISFVITFVLKRWIKTRSYKIVSGANSDSPDGSSQRFVHTEDQNIFADDSNRLKILTEDYDFFAGALLYELKLRKINSSWISIRKKLTR